MEVIILILLIVWALHQKGARKTKKKKENPPTYAISGSVHRAAKISKGINRYQKQKKRGGM